MAGQKHRWVHLFLSALIFSAIIGHIWWFRDVSEYSWVNAWPILAAMVGINIYYREGLSRTGFCPESLSKCFREYGLCLACLLSVLMFAGWLLGTIKEVGLKDSAVYLGKYFFFGLAQQYILNGFFVNRLGSFYGGGNRREIAAIVAFAFAGSHFPNWFLMLVTGAAGYICGKIFLEHRNIYFLGVAHGLVGFTLNLVVPDWIIYHLIVGPAYFVQMI